MEDILKGHGSTSPTPNWKNTDVQKWCSTPWEIAKCFINAPGYSDKSNATDIDTPGLLHVFINNINLHAHLSDKIKGSDTLKQTLQKRNELFHSPTMEMEDTKLNECIDEIIAILQDEKTLKARNDAQQAVNEIEVCRDALASITNKSEELKQTIQDAKDDIGMKQSEAKEAIGDTANECRDAVVSLTNQSTAELKQAIKDAKDDISKKSSEATEANEGKVKECRDVVASVTKESAKLKQTIQEANADIGKERAEATEAIKDKTQKALQEIGRHSEILYERVGRLEIDSSLSKQRLTVLENKIGELDNIRLNRQRQLEYVEGKQVLQKKLVELYQKHYVNTSISPLKLQENVINIKEVYVAPEMVVEVNTGQSATNYVENTNIRPLTGYRELLHTKHKQIYIVGDIGTGKSTFSKMMIQTWCTAVTADKANHKIENKTETNRFKNSRRKSKVKHKYDNDHLSAVNDGDMNEMKNYDFLFFVPLQRMSGLSDITEMIKAILTEADIYSNDLINKIFEQESERCLIVADGLDEWTPPKKKSVLQHVSYGLPNRARAKHATVITLSRPSAKGILNMRSSECDLKVELLGIKSLEHFIKTYMSKLNKPCLSYRLFMKKVKSAKLYHLEKTPLLLQQLVWLYGTGNEFGICVSDTYSHLLNIMFGWSESREEGDDIEDNFCDIKLDKDMILPKLLRRFPRCEENKGFLLTLARVAFEALTTEMGSNAFGRSHLRERGVPKKAIDALIQFGILVEHTCFDPTLENTQMEFIHISYLEFLAAVYVSGHFDAKLRSIPPNNVLKDLFQKYKSAADVLQLSNVLKMICGLSPFLISEISKLVSDVVRMDESMISYRNSLHEYWYRYKYRYRNDHISDDIQRLILSCLSECDPDDQPMVSLCDVIIGRITNTSFIQNIIPENVLSLHAVRISDLKVWRWTARLARLQYMYIAYGGLPNREMVLLSTFIEETPLKCLTLYTVKCNYSNCAGHTIDLSKHDQLQKLELKYCDQVIITNINTKRLENVHLGYSNISNIDCLMNANNLTELVIRHAKGENSGNNERVNAVVHTLHKLRKLRLVNVEFVDSALTVTSGMRNLEHVELLDVSMNLEKWCTFVESLANLQQSIQVNYYRYSLKNMFAGRYEDACNYVRKNTAMFEMIPDERAKISFRTKKK